MNLMLVGLTLVSLIFADFFDITQNSLYFLLMNQSMATNAKHFLSYIVNLPDVPKIYRPLSSSCEGIISVHCVGKILT